jgi:hypothetical protein
VHGERRRDPFGISDEQDADRVVVVPGETHALKGHRAAITAAVADWLTAVRDLWPSPAAGDRAPGWGREKRIGIVVRLGISGAPRNVADDG